MRVYRRLRLAQALAIALLAAAAAGCIASCASQQAQSPAMGLTGIQLSPAAPGSCEIDAVRMCQVAGGIQPSAPQPATASSLRLPSAPESIEFQIPVGQTIKLMCYYDPQHASVYRADATAESALTGNSVDYLKQHGFCVNK